MEKTVIVSGGSRGLGLGLVEDLLEKGYRVATCSRGKSPALDELIANNSDRIFWRQAAIGEEAAEADFVNAASEWAMGSLWGLVNNAAIAGEGVLATFPNIDTEKILGVNLLGSIRMARLVSRELLRLGGSGRIVNITSIVGLRGYNGLVAYSASKAGLDGATRALARELGRRGITVNSIAPGYFDTDLSASLSAEQREQIIRRTPLGRLAKAADLIPAIRFLLSEDASFITGHTMVVDGGITI